MSIYGEWFGELYGDWWAGAHEVVSEVTGVVDSTLPALRCRAYGYVTVLDSGVVSTYVPQQYRSGKVNVVLPAIVVEAEGVVGVAGRTVGVLSGIDVSCLGKSFERVLVRTNAEIPRIAALARAEYGVTGKVGISIGISVAVAAQYDLYSDRDLEEIAALLMVA